MKEGIPFECQGLPEREVTSSQLFNWRLLKKGEECLLASNAFVLLTSDYFMFSKTQCALFKGKERTVFLDKREFTGPIYLVSKWRCMMTVWK